MAIYHFMFEAIPEADNPEREMYAERSSAHPALRTHQWLRNQLRTPMAPLIHVDKENRFLQGIFAR